MRNGMRLAAVVACVALVGAGRGESRAEEGQGDAKHLPYYLAMDPPIVYPGAIIRLQVRPPAGATAGSVFVAGRRYLGQIEDGIFTAYFAVDIDTLPGPYELSYDVGSRHGTRVVTVRARRMDEEGRGERSLTREDLMVEELVRSNPRLVSLWNRTTLERYWKGAFVTPTSGPMVATFAMRRTSDTSLGSPHTGVDLAPRGGAEVKSAGVGVVEVVATGPGGSKLIVVDHGFGLYSYYFGIGEVFVEEGAWVRNGGVLGTMPNSSKAVLHFGARLAGAQVDPVSLPGITLKVPALSGEKRAPKEEKDRQNDYDY
jgi:murein DD-endopeptidase MepM/ murein hydrolase activator NlpD